MSFSKKAGDNIVKIIIYIQSQKLLKKKSICEQHTSSTVTHPFSCKAKEFKSVLLFQYSRNGAHVYSGQAVVGQDKQLRLLVSDLVMVSCFIYLWISYSVLCSNIFIQDLFWFTINTTAYADIQSTLLFVGKIFINKAYLVYMCEGGG